MFLVYFLYITHMLHMVLGHGDHGGANLEDLRDSHIHSNTTTRATSSAPDFGLNLCCFQGKCIYNYN